MDDDYISPREQQSRDADRAGAIIFWCVTIFILLIAIYGCATPQQYVDPSVTPAQAADCELRATEVAASIRDGLEAGFAKIDVRKECLRAAALHNAEAAR